MNDKIISVFKELYDLRVGQGEEWRAKAYKNAVSMIESLDYEITSSEMVKSLPGFGPSLTKKIDEIIKTGTVPELSSRSEEFEQERDVLKLFESIHRVGPVTAKKWYNKGYRKIEDIPESETTDAQWIGIELHSDLSQRIPREEIDEFNNKLHACLDPKGIFFEIAGSYRRERPDSGDIDVLLIDQENRDILGEVLECPIFTHNLTPNGTKKVLSVGKVRDTHRRIDLELVQPNEYPFAIVYFTGPGGFNVKMREHTSNMGYTLNEKSITGPNGETYPAKSEEHVFELLGLKYLTPQERDKYQ